MSCDLHCHSKISDGSLDVTEILALARQSGLSAISITDHDSVDGANTSVVAGKRFGIQVIHGIEMSAKDHSRNRKVHILGYLCDHPEQLQKACDEMLHNRRIAAEEMQIKVMQHYPITSDLISRCASGSSTIYKQHIMHALVEAGYSEKFFGDTFRELFSSHGGTAYVPIEYPDVRHVINLIHSAGGIAVLAHPYTYDSIDLMHELVSENMLDGIEVWHPSNDEHRVSFLSEFADLHHLVKTGGTDFHGMYTDTPHPIGYRTAPDNVIQQLYEAKNKRFKK